MNGGLNGGVNGVLMRSGMLMVAVLLGACEDRAAQADRQQALSTAVAGMNRVRALPGGNLAAFTEVRLVGGDTVCGRIDGRDGFGARAFGTKGAQVLLADPRDPASGAAVSRLCDGRPSRGIVSRNAQFSDLDLTE